MQPPRFGAIPPTPGTRPVIDAGDVGLEAEISELDVQAQNWVHELIHPLSLGRSPQDGAELRSNLRV